MDDRALSFEYDMATMALKGKRFREAEAKFKEVAFRLNTAEAWCGLGVSKYGLIMEEERIEEIFYCFDKAIKADEIHAGAIEALIIESSLEVVRKLYDVLLITQQSIDKAKTERTIAAISALVGTIMTLDDRNNGRFYSSIVSAGFTAVSYTSYVKAGATIEEMKRLDSKVQTLIEEIKLTLSRFVTHDMVLLDKFNTVLSETHEHITVTIPLTNKIQKLNKKANRFKNAAITC
jgi:hypothetical protein